MLANANTAVTKKNPSIYVYYKKRCGNAEKPTFPQQKLKLTEKRNH